MVYLFTWGIPGVYTQGLPRVYLGFTWGIPVVDLESPGGIPGVFPGYTWDIPEVELGFTLG